MKQDQTFSDLSDNNFVLQVTSYFHGNRILQNSDFDIFTQTQKRMLATTIIMVFVTPFFQLKLSLGWRWAQHICKPRLKKRRKTKAKILLKIDLCN